MLSYFQVYFLTCWDLKYEWIKDTTLYIFNWKKVIILLGMTSNRDNVIILKIEIRIRKDALINIHSCSRRTSLWHIALWICWCQWAKVSVGDKSTCLRRTPSPDRSRVQIAKSLPPDHFRYDLCRNVLIALCLMDVFLCPIDVYWIAPSILHWYDRCKLDRTFYIELHRWRTFFGRCLHL